MDIPLWHCIDVIQRYLDRHGRSYASGSGDRNFTWLSGLIERTWYDRSFATQPHPASKHEHDNVGDYGADEQSRQAGRRTRHTSRLPNFDPTSAVGAFSRATPSRSTSADQIIPAPSGRSGSPGKAQPSPKKLQIAVAWLRTELAAGEQAAAVVEAKALCAGIAPRTFDRARQRLGVTSRRMGFGRWATYMIALPAVHGTPSEGTNMAGAT